MLLFDGSNVCHRALEASKRDKGYYDYLLGIPYALAIIAGVARRNDTEQGILVAFDDGIPIHRRELLREYKPDKVPTGEVSDFILSKMNKEGVKFSEERTAFLEHYKKLTALMNSMILPLLGCISIRVQNCEADDILAFWTKEFPDEPGLVISSDRDLLQLITETVEVYEPLKKHTYGLDEMEERGYLMEDFKRHFLYSKAIIGDMSDNIPGIDGISDKNALPYAKQIVESLRAGATLEEAFSKLERNPRAAQKALDLLKENSEMIQRNYNLMDLDYTRANCPQLISKIRRSILFYLKLPRNYDKVCNKLSSLNLSFSDYRQSIDTIFDSNVRGNGKELLESLV